MPYTAPETGADGQPRLLNIPRDAGGPAARRRQAIETWAKHTHGWVGPQPRPRRHLLRRLRRPPGGVRRRGAITTSAGTSSDYYQRRLARRTCTSPTPSSRRRSRAGHHGLGLGGRLHPGRRRRGDATEGIVIAAPRCSPPAAAVADELFITCIKPLGPEDQDFALASPSGSAAGLKLYCRRPYAPAATSAYDYPLSTRYDETDALVVFDDVLVPWERVFVDRDVDGVRAQFFDTRRPRAGQLAGADPLRGQAAVHRRPRPQGRRRSTASTGSRRCRRSLASSRASRRGGRVRGAGRRVPPPRTTTGTCGCPGPRAALRRHGAAVRDLPAGARHPARPGGRWRPGAAVQRRGPDQQARHPGRHRPLRAVARRAEASERIKLFKLGLGRHRLRVRRPAPAVRDVLRRGPVRGPRRVRLPQLRLRAARWPTSRRSWPVTAPTP